MLLGCCGGGECEATGSGLLSAAYFLAGCPARARTYCTSQLLSESGQIDNKKNKTTAKTAAAAR